MWDIAPTYSAMVIFAEHRYYGKSLPFGNDSFKDAAHLNFLTTEQALADFAVLLQSLKVLSNGWVVATSLAACGLAIESDLIGQFVVYVSVWYYYMDPFCR